MKVFTKDRMHIIDIPENASLDVTHVSSCFIADKEYWFITANSDKKLATFEIENEARDEMEFLFDALQNGEKFYEM